MKNKHGLHSASHNSEVFKSFCDLASEFSKEDLLETLISRYWDDQDLKGISIAMEEVLDERREPNKYKLRAECLNDVMDLFDLIEVESYTIENIGFSDVLLSFSSKDDWFHIDNMLEGISDSHVMRETLAHADDYTGDRDASYYYTEDGDVVQYKQSLSMYGVMRLICDFNKSFRTNYTSIKSFNEGANQKTIKRNVNE